MMMLKSSPVRCTIPALVAVAYKREQHKNTLSKASVWSRPNTLRMLSQKSFYNFRVLERSQSRVLAWVQLHVVRPKGVECLLKVAKVVALVHALHQHVVDIDLYVPAELAREHLVH